jgi:hypothetical protein
MHATPIAKTVSKNLRMTPLPEDSRLRFELLARHGMRARPEALYACRKFVSTFSLPDQNDTRKTFHHPLKFLKQTCLFSRHMGIVGIIAARFPAEDVAEHREENLFWGTK